MDAKPGEIYISRFAQSLPNQKLAAFGGQPGLDFIVAFIVLIELFKKGTFVVEDHGHTYKTTQTVSRIL